MESLILSIQSFAFLRRLKKAQKTEDATVTIFLKTKKMGIVVHNRQPRQSPILDISKYESNIFSILGFLERKKFIEKSASKAGEEEIVRVKVLHEGWHIYQTLIAKITSFLFRSILVPIIVALITTIAANYIIPS